MVLCIHTGALGEFSWFSFPLCRLCYGLPEGSRVEIELLKTKQKMKVPVDVTYEENYNATYSSENNLLKLWMDFEIVSQLRDMEPRL